MFCSESIHTLDDKGRVFVPKRFQDELSRAEDGTRVAYLARGPDACLYLYSEFGFQRALGELTTRVFTGEDVRAVKRIFFANTQRVELDSSGRILIPERLREGASLGKDVVMVGVGEWAEIWGKSAWEKYHSSNLGKLHDIDRVLAGEQRSARPDESRRGT